MGHVLCGLLGVGRAGSVPFGNNFGVYCLGWYLGVRGTIRPALELAIRVGRLNALTLPTVSFADFCWNFEEGDVEGCSWDLSPDMDVSRCNILRDCGERGEGNDCSKSI